MDPFLGEVRIFFGNFAPKGWAFCEGQLLPISQNTALFSLLGTSYGGDGRSTFAFPDLSGRVPLHAGADSLYGFDLGAYTEATTWRRFRTNVQEDVQKIAPEAAKMNAPTEEPTETHDPNARAMAQLQRLAGNLSESQEQTQRIIKSHAEIVNRIVNAAAHVREYQTKSMEGEFGDAGASLKALVQTIGALNQDPNALPELQSLVEKLTESHEQTRQVIEFQAEVVGAIKNAAEHVGEYQARLSRGELEYAGASLQMLFETVKILNCIWDPNRGRPDTAAPTRLGYSSSRGQMNKGSSVRFLAVSFMIAMQGVFPPRN